jgi:DNA-binding NtrC family response regulator
LENVLQQAVLVCRESELLVQHLPTSIRPRVEPTSAGASKGWSVTQKSPSHGSASDEASLTHRVGTEEREIINEALVQAGHSRSRAASSLGISRVTLYKKMKKYGLMRSTSSLLSHDNGETGSMGTSERN